MDNQMTTGGSTVTVYRTDGTVVATLQGRGLGDEHAIGAYVVTANDGSGKEWTVDPSGAVKPVAPAAAQLLALDPYDVPLIIDSTSAILGCVRTASGDCTAYEVNLVSGMSRPLLTAPAINGQPALELGPSLTTLDISYDLQTVWFREVILVPGAAGQSPSAKLDIAAVDLRTGVTTRHDLPVALVNEHDLAISRDGKSVAGQEPAGTNAANLAIRHLHVVSVLTGVDSDVQGTAPYTGGLRSPSIQFAPDGASVIWWGGLDNGDNQFRINVAPTGGVGKTLPLDGENLSNLRVVFWLDGTRLVTQSVPPGSTRTLDKESGAVEPINPGVYADLDAVMY